MPPIRFRMNKLMAWVVLIALNLGGLRALMVRDDDPLMIFGVVLGALLQFAAYQGFRNRGRDRAFWLAFAASGTIATGTIVRAALVPKSIPGQLWRRHIVATILNVATGIRSRIVPILGDHWSHYIVVSLVAFGCALPIIGLAGAVGLIARPWLGRPVRPREPEAGSPAPPIAS